MIVVADRLVNCASKYAVSGFHVSSGGIGGRSLNITATINEGWVYCISVNVMKAFKNQDTNRLQLRNVRDNVCKVLHSLAGDNLAHDPCLLGS
jgi:hypothetical protein